MGGKRYPCKLLLLLSLLGAETADSCRHAADGAGWSTPVSEEGGASLLRVELGDA